jgi:hypothetical protein
MSPEPHHTPATGQCLGFRVLRQECVRTDEQAKRRRSKALLHTLVKNVFKISIFIIKSSIFIIKSSFLG